MEIINHIIRILISADTYEEKLLAFGKIKKHIGNNLIFEPKIEGVLGLGLVIKDNHVTKVIFSLKDGIPFYKLKELIIDFQCGYNHFDEVTVVSFEISNNIVVNAKVNGFIYGDEILNCSFSEFEMKIK